MPFATSEDGTRIFSFGAVSEEKLGSSPKPSCFEKGKHNIRDK